MRMEDENDALKTTRDFHSIIFSLSLSTMTNNHSISRSKVLLLGVLLVIALILGSCIFLLQWKINQEKLVITLRSSSIGGSSNNNNSNNNNKQQQRKGRISSTSTTIQSTELPNPYKIFSLTEDNFPPPYGSSQKTIGQAYWRHVSTFLQEWDATMMMTNKELSNVKNWSGGNWYKENKLIMGRKRSSARFQDSSDSDYSSEDSNFSSGDAHENQYRKGRSELQNEILLAIQKRAKNVQTKADFFTRLSKLFA